MKKVISIVLTCFLTLTVLSPITTVLAWEASTTEADVRVGVMADGHVSSGQTSYAALALDAFNTMAGGVENLDGLALVGDMVYNTNATTVNADHYTALYEVIDAANADTPQIYAMGNHEYPQSKTTSTDITIPAQEAFVTGTGQELKYHTTFGDAETDHDYHFITANAESYNGDYSTETESWLMAEVDKALAQDSTNANEDGETFAEGVTPNSVKPVFLLLHHPIQGTAARATTVGYSDDFIAYLKTRPQVIVFSAHSHLSYRRAEQIWQDGFTVFQAPLLSNGKVSAIGTNAFSSTIYEHGAVMLEVKDNIVSLQVFDVGTNEYIGDPWVIDIPSMVADRTDSDTTNDNDSYLWSPDKRAAAVAPYFPEDARIKVALDDRNATVTFTDSAIPTETANQRDGLVFGYRVQLCDADGNVISTKVPATAYYDADYTPASGTSMSLTFTGLSYSTEYLVRIYPLAPFATGAPLEKLFETETASYGETITYEAEDYAALESDIATNANASGENNEYVYVYRTTTDPSVSIPVTITDAGYYDIVYAVGQDTTGGYTSTVTTTITDTATETTTTLGTNGSSYAEDLCTSENWPSGSVRMRLYEKQNMYLDEGSYTVNITASLITKAPNKDTYICAFDYVSFKPIIKENAAKEVYYEGENYLTARVYASSTATEYTEATGTKNTNASFHGGAYASSNFSGNYKAEIDIPVTVDEAGTYYLTFKTICTQAHRVSKITLTLDGSVIFSAPPAPSATNFWQTWEFPATLSAGENIITLTTYKASSNTNVYTLWDYLKVSDKKSEVYVEKIINDKTIIQAEDYQVYRINSNVWYPSTNNVVSDSSCSAGAYVDSVYQNPGGTKYLDIPVKIYNGGYYTITPRIKHTINQSGYTLYVDGKNVATLSTYSQATAWLETGTKVLLAEGEHTITIRSKGTSNHCRIIADCVTLTYDNPTVSVPAEGKLIEAEDNPLLETYLKTTTTTTSTDEEGNSVTSTEVTESTGLIASTPADDTSASGESKIEYNYYKANTDTVSYSQRVTWNQPINVEESGEYVITYTVNQSANYHSVIYTALDGTTLETADSVGTGTPGLIELRYLKELTAGEHTITVIAKRDWNDNCTLAVDCVNIVPVEASLEAANISDENTTTLEIEDYKDNMFIEKTGVVFDGVVVTDESYSGGEALHSDYQNGDASTCSDIIVTFPVNVTSEGIFDVEFAATGTGANRTYGIKLYIDGVLLATTNHAGFETLMAYTAEDQTLTAGVHVVKVEITKYHPNAHGTLDYVKFIPNESVTYNAETQKVSASVNVDTVGSVIIALYDAEEKVCGVYTEVISAAKSVKVSEIACTNVPVSCKLFVWEDLINVKPLTDARTITIE